MVGLAGNLAFHYIQTHETVPVVATAPAEAAVTPTASAGSLAPLGPAIEVAPHPMPPGRDGAPTAAPLPAPAMPTAGAPNRQSLEFSDLWHPYRAVQKGFDWAGEQVS